MKFNVTLLLLLPSLALMSQTSVGEAVISVQSGAWNDASTWDCACVPGASHEVTLMNGHTVDADGLDTLRAESFSMNAGSTLLFPVTSRMEVASSLSSLGQVQGRGTVAFVGDGPHQCGPARLEKLALGSGTTNLVDSVFIQSQLHLGAGELNTSGHLVLEGVSGLTSDGGTVIGQVIRRYDWTKTSPYTFQIGSGLSGALASDLLEQVGATYTKQWSESETSYLSLAPQDELPVGFGLHTSLASGTYNFNWEGEAVTEA